ncbi:protein SPA1-RELATED 4-like isoform X1 [Lycium ferocissimum]|uniref:protein SPA1-RELATED 4-like isoform X1 n=1 Tax=Lycium ferocissimum TaxID=112874 RepID=UPI002816928A|nr:protein SPA1-RELATED 4-like isoform X1 [Lycium ferocissimum]
MEGSSESGWEGSDSYRGLNSSAVVDRNPSFQTSSIRSSDDVLHDSESVPGRKGRERIESLPINRLKAQGGVTEDRLTRKIDCSDVSLRQWLDNPDRAVDALECFHIFTQIVEIVNLAHSQGIVVHKARPSCFVMSSFKRIAFIESASCSDSGSDSSEDGLNSQTIELKDSSSVLPRESDELGRQSSQLEKICTKASIEVSEANKNRQDEEKKHTFPMKQILLMETNWYTSPEEIDGAPSSCASDIYRLGVLLFELFCTFSSPEEKCATMNSLRHRVLPPPLLLKWPKEASYCLWLLHPEPSNRPKMGELLESEFLNAPRDEFEEREAAIELREKIEEQELLLEFLLLLQQRKQEAMHNLREIVSFLSSDIEEVSKMQKTLKVKGGSNQEPVKDSDSGKINIGEDDDSGSSGSRKRFRPGLSVHITEESDGNLDENKGSILAKNSRLMKNFRKLEAAYFMARCRVIKPTGKPLNRYSQVSTDCRTSVTAPERSSFSNLSSKEGGHEDRQSGSINSFLEGLCKYLSYSKLEVKADLKQGDLLNSSNLVCALGFDRDDEFFATAGVNKKIKVFEYNSIVNEDRDIHYPVVEMASRSKLSSICWNGYIKSQIASSNFEGVVQIWDVTRSQIFMEMREHERRVWSVDFSVADPTMLASGSDDGSVKLWNINQGVSVGTIKTKANVCCVQFPFDSGRSLAFGSADHKIYYYDLRNSKMPLCTLIGHNKTVSYVKFIDSTTLVSASTDNTLKLWDLSICGSRILDSPLQSFTGHMNVKNFVGLSVSEGYIATGSETNEVFVYHKAFPMPALSFKFNSTDPLSGDVVDDQAQFISSVCWRGQSSTLVAANSMGNIKLLEMV